MKFLRFLSIIATLLTACSTTNKKPETTAVATPTEQMLTFTGTYESKQGVMTPLSCYCGNGGYLTPKDEKRIAICFEGNNDWMTCKNMTITGFYKTIKNNPEPTSPCPKGEMTYLKVVTFKCID